MDKQNKDSLLIKKAQRDLGEFELLYEKYSGKIFNYFWYRLGHDKQTADDLTQETFLRAFQKIEQYQDRGYSYLTYLLRIAHNILANYFRDTETHETLESAKNVPAVLKDSVEDKLDFERFWINVQRLPLLEKEVILLRYRREMEIQEIAEIVNKSKNAVNLLLSRARKRLRQHHDQLEVISALPQIRKPESSFFQGRQ